VVATNTVTAALADWPPDGRLSTVGLRMGRASENAQHIAAALAGHRKLEGVVFPTLFEDAEQKRIVDKQCDQPGAMLSLVIKGGKKGAFDFLRTIRIARNAVSLFRCGYHAPGAHGHQWHDGFS
jgi:cystathionine beta-lyase/cystathionine gamma-synthase